MLQRDFCLTTVILEKRYVSALKLYLFLAYAMTFISALKAAGKNIIQKLSRHSVKF